MKGCIKSWLSLKSSVSKTAMCRLVKQQSQCADDPTKANRKFSSLCRGNVPKYHLSLQQTVHQALRLISAFKISDKNIY